MRITVFASGSTGNCALASLGGAKILIDDGISLRRLKGFLAQEGLTPDGLDAVFITHEHRDHISGLPMLVKYHGVRILANRPVASRLDGMIPQAGEYIEPVQPGESVKLGGVTLTPFPTRHDTPGSCGLRLDSAEGAMGFCTDLGAVTDEVKSALAGVKVALIEANHDVDMLCDGPYPAMLKRRVLSEHGHLSNEECAKLAVFLAQEGAQTLILGHISRENNTPGRALNVVGDALSRAGVSTELLAAPPLGPVSVEELVQCPA